MALNLGSIGMGETGLTPAAKQDRTKLADAAEQFEAMMIGELMKSSRGSGEGGWLGTGDDQAGQTGMEMAEQQFARSLAHNGGLGISRMILANMKPHETPASTDATPQAQ